MKYMTFNGACAFAGVANMLTLHGLDTDDRTIALGMHLPWLFVQEDDMILAGPMLQSAHWFNLYLHPLGFTMTETAVEPAAAADFLQQQKTAMLGIRTERGKHAIVYTGCTKGALRFLNNKHEDEAAPDELLIPPAELPQLLDSPAIIATLEPTAPTTADYLPLFEQSIEAIRQNVAHIQHLSHQETTISNLRTLLDPLFRPLLLDGITMLGLIGEDALAARFAILQRSLLSVLRQSPTQHIRLADHLSFSALSASAEDYICLIQRKISEITAARGD